MKPLADALKERLSNQEPEARVDVILIPKELRDTLGDTYYVADSFEGGYKLKNLIREGLRLIKDRERIDARLAELKGKLERVLVVEDEEADLDAIFKEPEESDED